MEIVEIKCPRSLNLKTLESSPYKEEDIKGIFQTIDIYDFVRIHQEIKKETGIIVVSKIEIKEETKDNIRKLVFIFSNYTGIPIRDLIVEIEKDQNQLLESDSTILAGLLIGLNEFFKTYLTFHELVFLGNKVDLFIPYYLEDGYKKVDSKGRIKFLGENPYTKYILLEGSQEISKEELERMKSFKDKYDNLDYGTTPERFYFVAGKGNIPSNFVISLKKEFPSTRIYACKNTIGHKVIKYLK